MAETLQEPAKRKGLDADDRARLLRLMEKPKKAKS